jgi:hypothetical protein
VPKILINKACLKCNCGSAESLLTVSSDVCAENNAAAKSTDAIPFVNIKPFGFCSIARAPCVPVTSVWTEVSNSTYISGTPVASEDSKLICAVGGVITCTSLAQNTVFIDSCESE